MTAGTSKGFFANVKHMFDLRDVVQDMGVVSARARSHPPTHSSLAGCSATMTPSCHATTTAAAAAAAVVATR